MDFTPTQWRWLWAAALGVAYVALCVGFFIGHRREIAQKVSAAQKMQRENAQNAANAARPVLVAWGSQTGQAQQLAEQTAAFLRDKGLAVVLCALNAVDAALLAGTRRALVVASTYGEGDAPDSAAVFSSQIMGLELNLEDLEFATLALGDAQYAQFCGFARALDGWLVAQGARPAFGRVEVNMSAGGDSADGLQAGLMRWQAHLVNWLQDDGKSGQNGLTSPKNDFWTSRPQKALEGDGGFFGLGAPVEFGRWCITRRELLNAGSQGDGVWLLDVCPADGALPSWSSGDLLDVHTAGDGGHARSYSIASIPADGRLQLLVRQARRTDGGWGHTSTALCVGLPVVENLQIYQADSAIFQARIKPHAAFGLGGNEGRPLVLIGNGTGLAGLRSHLHARAMQWGAEAAPAPCWLFFGERQRHCDSLLRPELMMLKEKGVIARLDWAFSRDVDERGEVVRVYVQDRVREAGAVLREWVHERDAAIYVCGSLKGMAAGVDEALREVLGSDGVDALLQQGRYRRDVY